MEKMRKLLNSRLGVLMGVATGLLFLAVVAVSHAATEPQDKGKGGRKFTAQQLCQPVVSKEQCQHECPPVKVPEKNASQATSLRSTALRPRKKSKSEARQARGHPHDTGLTCGQCLSPKRQPVGRESVAHPAFSFPRRVFLDRGGSGCAYSQVR